MDDRKTETTSKLMFTLHLPNILLCLFAVIVSEFQHIVQYSTTITLVCWVHGLT